VLNATLIFSSFPKCSRSSSFEFAAVRLLPRVDEPTPDANTQFAVRANATFALERSNRRAATSPAI
jgi:hypothetical protein